MDFRDYGGDIVSSAKSKKAEFYQTTVIPEVIPHIIHDALQHTIPSLSKQGCMGKKGYMSAIKVIYNSDWKFLPVRSFALAVRPNFHCWNTRQHHKYQKIQGSRHFMLAGRINMFAGKVEAKLNYHH